MASRGGVASDSEIRGKWVPLAIRVVPSSASQVFVSIAALNWSFAGRRVISHKAHAQVPDRARHRNDLGRHPGDSACNLYAFQRQYHAYLAFFTGTADFVPVVEEDDEVTPEEAEKSAGDDHDDMTTEKVLSQYGGISEMASSVDVTVTMTRRPRQRGRGARGSEARDAHLACEL